MKRALPLLLVALLIAAGIYVSRQLLAPPAPPAPAEPPTAVVKAPPEAERSAPPPSGPQTDPPIVPAVDPNERDRDEVDQKRGDLLGTVLSPAGNQLKRAMVTLYRQRGSSLTNPGRAEPLGDPVSTDDDGRFHFAGLKAGWTYQIAVEHGEYARAERSYLRVEGGGETAIPDIVLTGGVTLLGTALRADDGEPVEGAEIGAFDITDSKAKNGTGTPNRIVLTDAEGSYRMDGLTPSRYLIVASAEGLTRTRSKITDASTPRAEHRIDFRLEAGLSIAGRVLAAGTKDPIAGAAVHVRAVSGGGAGAIPARTSSRSDGRFRIDGLMEGIVYRVEITAKGFMPTADPQVAAGATSLRFTMVPTAGITGFVVQADGETPMPQFGLGVWRLGKGDHPNVRVGSYREVKAADGSFTVEDLQPGRYRIKAYANGFAPTWSDPIPVKRLFVHGITVTLKPGASLVGQVLNADDEPIAGATVRLLDNAYLDTPVSNLLFGKDSEKARPQRTDAEGRFEFTDLEADAYQIQVTAKGFYTLFARDIAVEPEQENECGPLYISEGGHLKSTVYHSGSGHPARGAKVLAIASDGTSREERTNAKGECTFENLLPGEYRVSAMPPAGGNAGLALVAAIESARSSMTVLVIEGQTVPVTLPVPGP